MAESIPTVLARLQQLFPQAHTSTLRRMVSDRRVELAGRIVRSVGAPAPPAQSVHIRPASSPSLHGANQVVYCDADIIICTKPVGLLTSTDPSETRPTLLALLQAQMDRQAPGSKVHLVHRLDRDASGLLIFARNVRSLAHLKSQFRLHTTTRRYHVWVHGKPTAPTSELRHQLYEDPLGGVRIAPSGKSAILHYRTIRSVDKHSLLEVTLFTGRKHQIRVQLAAVGCPVVGDHLYGPTPIGMGERLLLHATDLAFIHPRTGKPMEFRHLPPHNFKPPSANRRTPPRPVIMRKRRGKR